MNTDKVVKFFLFSFSEGAVAVLHRSENEALMLLAQQYKLPGLKTEYEIELPPQILNPQVLLIKGMANIKFAQVSTEKPNFSISPEKGGQTLAEEVVEYGKTGIRPESGIKESSDFSIERGD